MAVRDAENVRKIILIINSLCSTNYTHENSLSSTTVSSERHGHVVARCKSLQRNINSAFHKKRLLHDSIFISAYSRDANNKQK